MAEGRFDPMLLNIAQQHQGIDALLDTFFDFLARKTDFFTGGESGAAEQAALGAFRKYQEVAKKKAGAKAASDAERIMAEKRKEDARLARLEAEREEAKKKLAAAGEKQKKAKEEAAKKAEEAEGDKKEGEGEASEEAKEEEEKKGKILPNDGNGGDTDTYSWSQTLGDLEVKVPLPRACKGKELAIEIKKQSISVGLKGKTPIVEGKLYGPLHQDDCTWTIQEDGHAAVLDLQKVNRMEWWKWAVEGEAEIDLQKIEPENSKLDDLDADTRQTVEKMMFDQRQKAAGKPTSDEMEKQKLLDGFMKSHPELDFSKAKMC